jgi:PAS domain S-box-containing protein
MIKEINYKYFVENSNEVILFTSPNGKIIYANPAACEMFGKTEEEICEAGINGIADTSDPRFQLAINELCRTGSVECELILLRKDGTKFQGYLSSKVFIDVNGEERTSMHIKDITKFKKTEDELKESREKYKNLFNRAQIGMLRSLLDGSEMLEVNDKICEITGYKREELIGKSALMLWKNEEQRKKMVEIIRENGKVNDFEADIVTKMGSKITIITSVVLYPEEGIFEGSFIDITERKSMENAL